MSFSIETLLDKADPTKKPGGLLLALNLVSMIFAAASNTVAIIKDKDTKPEDKKLLVPAGVMTGVANIATYYAVTKKIIDSLEKCAAKAVGGKIERKGGKSEVFACPESFDLEKNAKEYGISKIQKAQKGSFFGLFHKKSAEDVGIIADTFLKTTDGSSVKDLLKNDSGNLRETLKNTVPTDYAKNILQSDIKSGAGVLGAFIGAVIGCSIITPIVRDVSAYIVQKKMEKNIPELQEKPYRPYFDPAHISANKYGNVEKQPLSMQSYMSFTNGRMKI